MPVAATAFKSLHSTIVVVTSLANERCVVESLLLPRCTAVATGVLLALKFLSWLSKVGH